MKWYWYIPRCASSSVCNSQCHVRTFRCSIFLLGVPYRLQAYKEKRWLSKHQQCWPRACIEKVAWTFLSSKCHLQQSFQHQQPLSSCTVRSKRSFAAHNCLGWCNQVGKTWKWLKSWTLSQLQICIGVEAKDIWRDQWSICLTHPIETNKYILIYIYRWICTNK